MHKVAVPDWRDPALNADPDTIAAWRKLKFGLFVHWGLYAINGLHEQEQMRYCVPAEEYVKLIDKFNPIKFNPDLECYRKMKEMMGDSPGHNSDNISKAQALKDATMAQYILANGYDPYTVLHFNGSYHSDDHQGILYYINEINKKTDIALKVITISTVEQDTIEDLSKENLGKGDFILCIPSGMTKTQ